MPGVAIVFLSRKCSNSLAEGDHGGVSKENENEHHSNRNKEVSQPYGLYPMWKREGKNHREKVIDQCDTNQSVGYDLRDCQSAIIPRRSKVTQYIPRYRRR